MNYYPIFEIMKDSCGYTWEGIPDGSAVKNTPVNTGDQGSIPGLGRASGQDSVQSVASQNPHITQKGLRVCWTGRVVTTRLTRKHGF